MITTGSKVFYGLAGAAFLAAVVYAMVTNAAAAGLADTLTGNGAIDLVLGPVTFGYKGGVGDHFGYSLLMGFAGLNLGLGVMTSAFRDGQAEAIAQVEVGAPASTTNPPISPIIWPLASGLGVGLLVVGLAVSTPFIALGAIVLALTGFEWLLAAWADRATADPAVNQALRARLIYPVQVPVGIVLGIAFVVLCISRLLLAVSEPVAAGIAGGLAALVLVAAFLLAAKPHLKKQMVVGALVLLGVVVIASGVIGAIVGPHASEGEGGHKTEHGAPAHHDVGVSR